MPLEFGEIEPAQIGQATRFDHPLNEWLGVKMGSGQAAQLGPKLTSFFGEGGDTSRKLTPKEADEQFGIPGHLKFDSDVTTERAQAMRQRKEEELKYAAYFQTASHSWLSGKALLGFGAEMLGANTHPVDLAINFLPFVGSEVKAARMAETGASAFRVALARGLVTEEAIAMSRVPLVARFPNFSRSTIDATLGNAVLEIPNFYLSRRDQTDYTEDDLLTNVFAGGLAGGAFGAALKHVLKFAHFGYEKLAGPTRDNMFKEGLGNHLSDDPRDIGDNARLDRADIVDTTAARVINENPPSAGIDTSIAAELGSGGDVVRFQSPDVKVGDEFVDAGQRYVVSTVSEMKIDSSVAGKSAETGRVATAVKKSLIDQGAEKEFQNRADEVIKSRLAQAERTAAGTIPEAKQRELQISIAKSVTTTPEQVDKFAKRIEPNDQVKFYEADAAAKTEVATEMEGSLNDYIASVESRAKELAESDPEASAKLLAEAEAVRNDLQAELDAANNSSFDDAAFDAMTNCITGI